MDYEILIERLKKETYWLGGSQTYSHDVHPAICDEAATAITDLLVRVHELETTHRVEMCEDGYDCVELGKARRDLMEAEEAAKAAAQKREIDWDAWKGCTCNSVQKSCCTCVSFRCQYCMNASEYKRGDYCSSCGRPLNGMARLKLEMRLKGE